MALNFDHRFAGTGAWIPFPDQADINVCGDVCIAFEIHMQQVIVGFVCTGNTALDAFESHISINRNI